MSKNQKYSVDTIRVVSPAEHVRLMPQAYFEELREEGNLDSLPIELSCHAIDEFMDGNCSQIEYAVFENHVVITYDAGISMTKSHGEYPVVNIFSKMFSCHNLKKHLAVGDEYCRLGIALVQHASEYCHVKTIADDEMGVFNFEKGEFISCEVEDAPGIPNATEITIKMEPTIFGELKCTTEGLEKRLKQLRTKLSGLSLTVTE